jgi:hypothetical protein
MRKTTTRIPALGLMLAAAGSLSCGRSGARKGRLVPAQTGIEFSAGAASVPEALAPRLAAIGVKSFFVPAVRATASGAAVSYEVVAAPAAPYVLPVYLEVTGLGDFDAAVAAGRERLADEIWSRVSLALSSGRYGKVAGLHLALRVKSSGEEYGDVLKRLRGKLPASQTLSAALFSTLSAGERKKWDDVFGRLDFLVPEIFGRVADTDQAGYRCSADLAEVSGAGIPMVAGVAPQTWGVFRPAGGGGAKVVPDLKLNDLSEDRRFDFAYGSLFTNADENEYVFTAKQRVGSTVWGEPARAGDTVTFRENRIVDVASALSAGRGAKARLIRLESLDDRDHLIGFSVVEDLLLGHPMQPVLLFSRSGPPSELSFVVLNSSSEFSELSRLNNWVDVRVDGAKIVEVRPGDFDRFSFVDEAGNPVSPARATRIRFFENFIAPGESMTAGPIRLSGPAKLAASGKITLPDGKNVLLPEAEVAALPGETGSGNEPPGRGKRLPGH